MNKIGQFLDLDPEMVKTILSSAFGIVSVFVIVSIGYYIHHYFIENKKK